MKKNILLTAAFAAITGPLCAQTLNVTAPGFTGHQLVTSTPGYLVTAVATDGAGQLFYLESDAIFNGTKPAKLWSVPFTASTVGTPSLLTSFAANLSGSFLIYQTGTLFLGENTAGGLYAINATTHVVDPLGTVSGNYDAAFSGGSLFVSNNPGSGNRVTKFSLVADGGGGLALSTGTPILSAGAQSSGPLAFTLAGGLIYGSSAGNLYRYSPAEVATGGLALDAGHVAVTNDSNGYLAGLGDGRVWHDRYDTNELRLIDTSTGSTTVVGTVVGFESLGDLDTVAGTLVVSVTDYGTFQSRIYSVVPEPTIASLLVLGLALLGFRRRQLGK